MLLLLFIVACFKVCNSMLCYRTKNMHCRQTSISGNVSKCILFPHREDQNWEACFREDFYSRGTLVCWCLPNNMFWHFLTVWTWKYSSWSRRYMKVMQLKKLLEPQKRDHLSSVLLLMWQNLSPTLFHWLMIGMYSYSIVLYIFKNHLYSSSTKVLYVDVFNKIAK